MPLAGYALQRMDAALLEGQARAGHEVLHGVRDEHFAGLRQRRDARADVDSDAAKLRPHHLALAGMEPGADLEPEAPDAVADRARGAYTPSRPVEGREETVARCVDFAP